MADFFRKNIGKFLFISFPILWLASGFTVYYLGSQFNEEQLKNSASLGDMFGVINALFSGLALAGVVYTIFQQEKVHKLQETTLDAQIRSLDQSALDQKESFNLQGKMLDAQLKGLEQSAKEQQDLLITQRALIEAQIKNNDLNSIFSARSILLAAYAKNIDWYYLEQSRGAGGMSQSTFQALTETSQQYLLSHEKLIEEMRQLLLEYDKKIKSDIP